ncbi:Rpn family recombination-promoting nuclease/putative transposase [Thiotrichales bacterium 19S11-10]|nr:Rpn family recombination-promoting nuclease/putative transposase [Thiotrichales bacterium 19S11-10]
MTLAKGKRTILTAHDKLFKANLSNRRKVEISLKTHLPKSLIQQFDFSSLDLMPTEFIKPQFDN